MRILMLNWRDLKNPKSGGAEVLTEGILSRLASNHKITLFSASFPGSLPQEVVNGYTIIRKGSPYTVHLWAFVYWMRYFRKQNFDVVVDQIHGIPFFTPLYMRNVKVVAFIHEVARDIWTQMYPFPVGQIGKFLEPIIFSFYRKTKFITVSNSTKQDLVAVGIPAENIAITPEAIDDEMFVPVNYSKEADPTLICIGRLAAMKRPEHVIEAYKIAREKIPNLKLWMVGGGEEEYVEKLKESAKGLSVIFFGKVGTEKKKELLAKAWILVSASMKEGFGLVVLEAAAHGTPSVVYDVPGFRDSIKNMETGMLSQQSSKSLAKNIIDLVFNQNFYYSIRSNSIEYSHQFTFERASLQFKQYI